MCDYCDVIRHMQQCKKFVPKAIPVDDDYEDDEDEDLPDPRCDFEKDPSLANGWFYNR